MPYVNVKILQGASREQKKYLVEDITKSLVERLGKKPEQSISSLMKSRMRTGDLAVC